MKMMLFFILVVVMMVRAAAAIAKPKCRDRCGDVMVPYPFGIDSLSCAKNESFLLNCNRTRTTNTLFLADIPISNISLENGTITGKVETSYACYYPQTNKQPTTSNKNIDLGQWAVYTISPTRNKLTALGCDTLVLMNDAEDRFGSGCISLCNNKNDTQIGTSCSGLGCCQTSIPKRLKTLEISVDSVYDHTQILDFNPCSFAFVAENSFDISQINISSYPKNPIPSPPIVLEWVISGDRNCQAGKGYSCGANATCSYSDTGGGYRCQCIPGFRGNPYLPQGCTDIDECKENTHRCRQGTCHNTKGSYICKCPPGTRGDNRFGCKGIPLTTIAIVIAGIILVAIITFLIFILFHKKMKERYFKENGGLILKHQRIRIFKEEELVKATNNYDTSRFLGEGGFGSVYKGVLPDKTLVAVKKAKGVDKARISQEFQHEMGIVSQVNHKNVVKILGLCLETKFPSLVYEFISNGTLYHHIHEKRSSVLNSWKNRLKIAVEAALALDYLHSLADPPIIHGDVKSMNILLDDHFTVKVSDFGASVLISQNQMGIASKFIQGTFGYLDPEYLMTGNLTVKSDVYSFGVVMVELLAGEKPTSTARIGEKTNIIQYFISCIEDGLIPQVLNFEPTDDGEMEEVIAVAKIVKRCLNGSGLRRPTMKEVAEDFARLKKLSDNFCVQHEIDSNVCLLGQSLCPYNEFTNINVVDNNIETKRIHSTLDME